MTLMFHSICDGKVVPIESVKDPVFSQKMMGDGLAFIPESNMIVSPVSGTIEMIYPTGHAVGIKTEEGIEILVHVGLNSFQVADKAIIKKVSVGDKVKPHDPLLAVNFDFFREKEIDTIIPVVFTDGTKVELLNPDSSVKSGDTPLIRVIE